MSKIATTPPPVFAVEYAGYICIQSGPRYGDPNLLDWEDFGESIAEANGAQVALAYNHHQELVTRLYNITNQIEIALMKWPDFAIAFAPGSGLLTTYTDARETLKKVIQ